MHEAAYDYVAVSVFDLGPFRRVVEFGSMDINGSIRALFGNAEYLGIDRHPGPGVDLVADAATWEDVTTFDCVVCCEIFEHTADWPAIVASAYRALRPGGYLIVTTAGPGRGPHSAFDGNALREGEHYANIDPADLESTMKEAGFDVLDLNHLALDVRATGVRPLLEEA